MWKNSVPVAEPSFKATPRPCRWNATQWTQWRDELPCRRIVQWNSSGLRFLRARGMFRDATSNDIPLHKCPSKLTRILCRKMCGVTVKKTSSPPRTRRARMRTLFLCFPFCTVAHPAELYLRHSCDPSRCCDLSSNLVSVTVATLEFHQRKSLLRARPVHEGRHCCSPNHL